MFDLEQSLWWYQGMREITASLLDENLQRKNNLRILDVGCGTGYAMTWLRRRFPTAEVFGVDRFYQAAALWRLHEIHTAAVASAEALPFAADEFDLLTCFDVIYQLSKADATQAASEFFRVLKQGGLLYIREPAYEWMRGSHDIVVATKHRFTRPRLQDLLAAQGFQIRRATYANTLLFPLAMPHRLLSRLQKSEASDVQPVHPLMNKLFAATLKWEARWLSRLSFPFGLSVIMVAEK
ncbi:MAG: class I SAM-dependent methyltransferase [Acidobacteria bacterium]|nr:class I SAM-dependent methyltransferase [Acidobacteriota bacterium]